MHTNQAVGRYGERVAQRYLQRHGYQILETNWRGAHGELDIIASRDSLVVIIEVKTRRGSEFGHPASAVNHSKLRRMKKLATEWLSAQEAFYPNVRFDVIAVLCGVSGAAQVEHLEAVV